MNAKQIVGYIVGLTPPGALVAVATQVDNTLVNVGGGIAGAYIALTIMGLGAKLVEAGQREAARVRQEEARRQLKEDGGAFSQAMRAAFGAPKGDPRRDGDE